MINVRFNFTGNWQPIRTEMDFVPRTGDIVNAHRRRFSVSKVEYDVPDATKTVCVTCIEVGQ